MVNTADSLEKSHLPHESTNLWPISARSIDAAKSDSPRLTRGLNLTQIRLLARMSCKTLAERYSSAFNCGRRLRGGCIRASLSCLSPPQRGFLSTLREAFVVKLRLRDNENVNDAVKRFRKLVEHAGIKREMRKREFYEKPSDERRRNRRRAEMRARTASRQAAIGG